MHSSWFTHKRHETHQHCEVHRPFSAKQHAYITTSIYPLQETFTQNQAPLSRSPPECVNYTTHVAIQPSGKWEGSQLVLTTTRFHWQSKCAWGAKNSSASEQLKRLISSLRNSRAASVNSSRLVQRLVPASVNSSRLVQRLVPAAVSSSRLVQRLVPASVNSSRLVQRLVPASVSSSRLVQRLVPAAVSSSRLVQRLVPAAVSWSRLVQRLVPASVNSSRLVQKLVPASVNSSRLVQRLVPASESWSGLVQTYLSFRELV